MKKGILTAVAAVVAIVLIGWAIWGIGVVVSGPKGQGDAVKINNSAANWTEKQQKFEKLNASVNTNKQLVELHKKRAEGQPVESIAAQTLAGVQSECIASVEAYNAESRKVLSQDWKSPDLPQTLTTTACL